MYAVSRYSSVEFVFTRWSFFLDRRCNRDRGVLLEKKKYKMVGFLCLVLTLGISTLVRVCVDWFWKGTVIVLVLQLFFYRRRLLDASLFVHIRTTKYTRSACWLSERTVVDIYVSSTLLFSGECVRACVYVRVVPVAIKAILLDANSFVSHIVLLLFVIWVKRRHLPVIYLIFAHASA